MLSKKPGKPMKVVLPSSYKGEQMAKPNTLQSAGETNKYITSPSEAASPMKKEKKQKDFNFYLKEAIEMADDAIRQRVLQQIMQNQIRQYLHSKYGDQVSAQELDQQAQRSARNLGYKLSEIKEVPAEFMHVNLASDKLADTFIAIPEALD